MYLFVLRSKRGAVRVLRLSALFCLVPAHWMEWSMRMTLFPRVAVANQHPREVPMGSGKTKLF